MMQQDDIKARLPFLIALGLGLTIYHRNGNKVMGRPDLVVSDHFRHWEWSFDAEFQQHVENVLAFLEDAARLVK